MFPDFFGGDVFNSVTLTTALEKAPFKPQWLGSMGVFEPVPVSTTKVAIEKRDTVLSLVPTTPRGAPLPQLIRGDRDIRDFKTARVAKGDRLMASEIQDVRSFGGESQLEQMQEVSMRRLMRLRDDVELTHENMRLGAIQGIVLDADGTPLINWFDEWAISQPAEIDFDLDNASPASGAVRRKCNDVVRLMKRAAKGAWTEGETMAVGLCGDNFWDDLTAHSEVRQTYLSTSEAPNLRLGNAFGTFVYGGITYKNYQGTDDNSTVAIGTDSVKFFPVGGRNVFQHARSPDETFAGGNLPGLEFYARSVPDRDRDQFVDLEVYSYPLFICSRPEMLLRGKRT
jgi:hypothetical protein